MEEKQEKQAYTIIQVSEMLGLSRHTTRGLLDKYDIKLLNVSLEKNPRRASHRIERTEYLRLKECMRTPAGNPNEL